MNNQLSSEKPAESPREEGLGSLLDSDKLKMGNGVSWVKIALIAGGAAILIFGLGLVYLYYYNRENSRLAGIINTGILSIPSPTPTPKPIYYEIPSGSQVYTFTHGSEVKNPKVQKVTIDPLDPKVGSNQSFVLEIESEKPVTKASIIVYTDTGKETEVGLSQTSEEGSTKTFEGSWTVDNPYDEKYAFRFIVNSEEGVFDNTMFIRQ